MIPRQTHRPRKSTLKGVSEILAVNNGALSWWTRAPETGEHVREFSGLFRADK
jgi:hypothetical protein